MPVCDGGTNESSDTVLLEQHYDAETTASLGVVDAVATLEGVDPLECGTDRFRTDDSSRGFTVQIQPRTRLSGRVSVASERDSSRGQSSSPPR